MNSDTSPKPVKPSSLPVISAPTANKPGYERGIEVGLRSLHIVSMGLVLGGIGLGGTRETLLVPIIATVSTGILLLITTIRRNCLKFTHGAGAAILLKLLLLGLGNVFEEARLPFYMSAALVSSVGSHMSSSWRHYPVFDVLRSLVGLGPRTA